MNLTEIKMLAKDRGIAPGRMRKDELIHCLQLQEGNPECYNTNFSDRCGQEHCLWRPDCR